MGTLEVLAFSIIAICQGAVEARTVKCAFSGCVLCLTRLFLRPFSHFNANQRLFAIACFFQYAHILLYAGTHFSISPGPELANAIDRADGNI